MKRIDIDIDGHSAGTVHRLTAFRFEPAPGATGPSVYVQGGLHADEGPGMMAAAMLKLRLEKAEADGTLRGPVTIVPVANPLGLSQIALGQQEGRFDFADGRNFNRHYPDLAAAVSDRLAADPDAATVEAIRALMAGALSDLAAGTPAAMLKKTLLGLALDADWVLDLHCDGEAEVHLYTQTCHADAFEPLSRLLGARAVLLAESSGDHPFDEALSGPWLTLAARFPDRGIPDACKAVTVELRGRADVSGDQGERDADALAAFLVHLGVIDGPRPALPDALCRPTPLAGSDAMVASEPGLLAYLRPLGDRIETGETVAEIIDPLSGRRSPVKAATSGIFYARADTRIAERGKRVGKIAGATPFRKGLLLSP